MAEQHMENQGQAQEDVNHLLKVRREKLAELQAAGKDPFAVTRYEVTAHSGEIKEQYEQLEGKEVSAAGRMMSKRGDGQGFLLPYPGSAGQHSGVRGQRQRGRRGLQRF